MTARSTGSLRGAVVWSFALVVAIACAPSTPPPPAVDTTGFERAVAEKLEGARNEVLERPSAESWGYLGVVYAAHHRIDEALVCFDVAEQLDPREYRWPYYAALVGFERDHTYRLDRLRRAHELRPEAPAIAIRLGDLLLLHGSDDEAAAFYEAARRLRPDDSHALLGLGKLALARGDLDESRRLLEEAIGHGRHHREAWVVVARVYDGLGLTRQARDAADRAQRYRLNTRIRDEDMNRIFAEAVTVDALLQQARQLLDDGRNEEAAERLRMVLREKPDHVEARSLLERSGTSDS